ncbi:MAG TPA: hypothetical protein DHC76_12800 [Rhodobacteraceae bacterium]|jgi:hypothetical protein|nr:hypothetical protein [Paracoccaceae bacterium]
MADTKSDNTPPDHPPSPLRVRGGATSHLTQFLMLKPKDLIVAVNGISWKRLACVAHAIKTLLERDTAPVVLTILRGEKTFDVITSAEINRDAQRLSQEQINAISESRLPAQSHNPSALGNYAIFSDMYGASDVVDLQGSLLAMVFPPLWFISRRLWEALATAICLLSTSFVINPSLSLIIYVAMCIIVGRKQVHLIQAGMRREGMYKVMVLATTSESKAQSIALQLHDKLTFRFAQREDTATLESEIGVL